MKEEPKTVLRMGTSLARAFLFPDSNWSLKRKKNERNQVASGTFKEDKHLPAVLLGRQMGTLTERESR